MLIIKRLHNSKSACLTRDSAWLSSWVRRFGCCAASGDIVLKFNTIININSQTLLILGNQNYTHYTTQQNTCAKLNLGVWTRPIGIVDATKFNNLHATGISWWHHYVWKKDTQNPTITVCEILSDEGNNYHETCVVGWPTLRSFGGAARHSSFLLNDDKPTSHPVGKKCLRLARPKHF